MFTVMVKSLWLVELPMRVYRLFWAWYNVVLVISSGSISRVGGPRNMKSMWPLSVAIIFAACKRSLGWGNIFTQASVCLRRGVGTPPPGCTHTHPGHAHPLDAVLLIGTLILHISLRSPKRKKYHCDKRFERVSVILLNLQRELSNTFYYM